MIGINHEQIVFLQLYEAGIFYLTVLVLVGYFRGPMISNKKTVSHPKSLSKQMTKSTTSEGNSTVLPMNFGVNSCALTYDSSIQWQFIFSSNIFVVIYIKKSQLIPPETIKFVSPTLVIKRLISINTNLCLKLMSSIQKSKDVTFISVLIKTITEFSNMIGCHQSDLSTDTCHACNWTV